MKGTRVQAIIRELRGEKIDIVEWSDDPITFVMSALSPARVQRVSIIDEVNRIIEVVVEDAQLSLAIGKKGQNVRLAAKLTGWRIDIKSEDEMRAEGEAQFAGLENADEGASLTLPGLSEAQLIKLSEAGLDTADLLLEATAERLSEVTGVDEETAMQLHTAVREQVATVELAAAEAAKLAEQDADATDAASDGETPTETPENAEATPETGALQDEIDEVHEVAAADDDDAAASSEQAESSDVSASEEADPPGALAATVAPDDKSTGEKEPS